MSVCVAENFKAPILTIFSRRVSKKANFQIESRIPPKYVAETECRVLEPDWDLDEVH